MVLASTPASARARAWVAWLVTDASLRRHEVVGLACGVENWVLASEFLVPLADDVRVAGVELDDPRGAAGDVGGDEGGAGPAEGFVDLAVGRAGVVEAAGDQLDGLHRWVVFVAWRLGHLDDAG